MPVARGTGSFSRKPLDTAPQMGAKTIRPFRGQLLSGEKSEQVRRRVAPTFLLAP